MRRQARDLGEAKPGTPLARLRFYRRRLSELEAEWASEKRPKKLTFRTRGWEIPGSIQYFRDCIRHVETLIESEKASKILKAGPS